VTALPARGYRTWLRNPLAILAEGAAGGVVVEGSRISELVPGEALPLPKWTALSMPVGMSSSRVPFENPRGLAGRDVPDCRARLFARFGCVAGCATQPVGLPGTRQASAHELSARW